MDRSRLPAVPCVRSDTASTLRRTSSISRSSTNAPATADQRLDDKDVAVPAITLELHAKAIVRIWLYLRWQQRTSRWVQIPPPKAVCALPLKTRFRSTTATPRGSSPGCNQGVRSDCRNPRFAIRNRLPAGGNGFEPSVPVRGAECGAFHVEVNRCQLGEAHRTTAAASSASRRSICTTRLALPYPRRRADLPRAKV